MRFFINLTPLIPRNIGGSLEGALAPSFYYLPFPLISETDNPIPYVPFTVRMNPMER
jgi:hypothetical protein